MSAYENYLSKLKVEDEKQEFLTSSLQQAAGVNPDEFAGQLQLAKAASVSVDSVPDYKKLAQEAQLFQKAGVNTMWSENPKTARFLSDPTRAKLSSDEANVLKDMENEFNSFKAVKREDFDFGEDKNRWLNIGMTVATMGAASPQLLGKSTLEGIKKDFQYGYAGFKKQWSSLIESTGLFKGIDKKKAEAMEAHGLSYDPKFEYYSRIAELQKEQERFAPPIEIQEGLQKINEAKSFGDFFDAVVENPGAVKTGIVQSMGMFAPVMAITAASAVVGPTGPSAMIPFFTQQALRRGAVTGLGSGLTEYGSTIDEVMSEAGVDLTDPISLAAAFNNEELMAKAKDKALKRGVSIGFFDALTASVAGKLLSGAKPTATSVGTRVAGELGIQAGGGAFGEATAGIITDDFKLGAVLFEALAEIPTGITEIPGNYKNTMRDAINVEQNTKAIEKLNELATANKIRTRDADTFNEWIDQATEDIPVQNVYINADVLQQSGVAQQLAEISPSVADQIESALITGDDIQIPIQEYMTAIAPTEVSAKIIDDLRLEGETMTRREATAFIDSHAKELQKAYDEQTKKLMQSEDFVRSAKNVENLMLENIKSTGAYTDTASRAYATYIRDMYVTKAAEMRMTPEELYKILPYSVVAEMPAVTAQMFSQEQIEQTTQALQQTPEFQNWFKDSKVVDENKKPLMVYHGTNKDFNEFASGKTNSLVKGIYFGSESEIAEIYAGKQDGAQIVPVYLSMQNPATNEDYDKVLESLPYDKKKTSVQRASALKKAGFDGLMYDISGKGTAFEYVVFEPTQIKSVFNEGSWSPETANILKQSVVPTDSQAAYPEDALEDAEADDIAPIVQDEIPDSVVDAAALDNADKVAKSQVWNKGRDLKMALQNAVKQMADEAGVNVSTPSEQTTDYLIRVGVRDALYALNQNPNAVGWYDEKTRQALAVMSLLHPEIATNENAKFAFVWAMAVTSNGIKVDKNFEFAEQAYSYYKTHKRMPTNIQAGQAQGAINKSLGLFNELVDAWGIDNLRKFMLSDFTVGEISAISKELKPGGEHADTKVKGAAIIGPKIGNGFFSNLYGNFDALTMDRWLVRTWGRWTGTLIKQQPNHIQNATERLNKAIEALTPDQAETLSKIIKTDIKTSQPETIANAVQKASMDKESRAEMNKTLQGEEIRKSGNGLAKYLDGQKEAPAGPHERTYIRSVFASILGDIRQDPQYADLTMADLQAALWYAEKRLYESAKEDIAVDEESTEGYSDEDAPDYANAAAALARSKGVSDRKINNALKKESKDERSRRSRLQDESAQGEVGGDAQGAGGFTRSQKARFAGAVATRIARSNRSGNEKQSWSYSGKGRGDGNKARVLKALGVTYLEQWKAGKGLGQIYRANGIATPSFYELDSANPANAQKFVEAISASKTNSGPFGAAVYVYSAEKYQGMRMFLAEDGLSGVAIKPDGDIVSVFASNGSGRSVVELAVGVGGTKLDAFETILPEFYAAHGFVASSRLPWDDTQAPEGWDKAAFAEFNNGEPNIVFMALDNTYQGWHSITDGKKAASDNAAVAEQNKAVKRFKKNEELYGKPTIFAQSGTGTGTRGLQPLRADDLTTTASYGQATDGSSSVVGIHYSREPRTSLTGYYYGTGLTGAEKKRLDESTDDRLRNRIHFYVDEGQGVRPESGVGGNVHSVNINNLYNVNEDPLGLRAAAEVIAGRDDKGLWFNTVESAILDAGFDGVYVPGAQGNQGVAVLLGPQHQSVPVDQNGKHSIGPSGAFEAPATGKRKYSLLSSEIKKFQAQEAEIKAAAPSAELVNGSLVFDEADLAAITEFFPPAAKAQQLRQEMRGGFDPTKLTTILTEKADYSTFLHETAHFYLTALFKMAEMPTATEQMKSDVQTILDWFGVKDLATWNAMSLEQQRKYHERWAYNHEIYVFEGKAPSIKLQTLFDRFSAWLRRVYKSIKEDLNAIYMQEYGEELPILTGEVRQVMDRMLASDEQIAQAEQVRGIMPIYQTQAESGMDDAEWAAYQEMQRDSHDTAVAEMTTASLRQMKWLGNARSKLLKEIQKKNADIRKDVRAQVAAEVAAEPLYRAMNFIKRGERLLDDGTTVKVEGLNKISIDSLIEMYGGEGDKYALFDWSQLGYGKYGMVAEEGLHPDFIAEQVGFQSGDEMVKALVGATPMKEAIETQTDQRMLEQYGDLNDAKAINTAVERALHNEARARFVAVELRHAAKATQPVRLMLQAAKNAAKQIIGGKLIRNVKASEYSIAEQRANKDAMNAMKKGNAEAVTKALQNRLLNNQLTAEASKVTDEVAEGLRYFKKVQSDRSRQRVGADYSDQIDSLLERFELKPISLKAIDARTSLANWIKAQEDAGYSPEIAPELLAEANRVSYKNMTVNQFRDLVDAVKTIEHMGRTQQDMLTSAKKVAYETARNEIVESINANAKNRVADTRTPNTALGRYAQSLKRFWASHIKAATVSRILDGGKDGGAMWEYFIRSANERGDKETTMRAEATTELTKIMQPIFKQGKMGGKGIYFPTLGMSLNKEARIAIALNTGNAGNLQRLLGGEGWTLDMVMPVLQSLTKQELEAVQKIWDYFETYRPEIAAKERRIYGKEPKWVDPTPMTITSLGGDDVEMRGGYYPIVYDPMASERAEAFADAQDIKQQMQGAYTSATTRRSFTKSRVEEVVGRPLLYTLGGMYNGINDVIHDLSWHEWLIDANKLLKSQSIDKAIRTQYGPEFKQQLKSWVNDVAVGERAAQQAGEIALNRLRQGVSAAGLGFNVMSAMQQITGFNQSIVRVGPKWIGRGIVRTLTNGTRAFKLVDEASPFMANRARTQFRELNELRNMVQDESSAMRAVKLGAYFMMMRMQRLVDVPTFIGAYEKAIAAGNDEARAIALGDQAVIDSQGGGMLKDLSAIERGGPALKIFTVFYSYMNTVLNLATTQTMTAESKGKLAADYLMLFTVPVILTYALKKGLVPSDDDDEFDMEKIGKELIAEQISYLMGTMIITREFSEAGKLILGTEGGNRSYSGPGGLRLVSDSYNLIKQIGQGEFDTSFRKAAINVIGGAAGLPSAQINRTWNGIEALVEGKTENLAAPILGFQGR
jgi:hypothetical protein